MRLGQGIISASAEWFAAASQDEIDSFFRDAFDFIKDKIGDENLLHFTIHYDETTPHAHFGFVPVTKDKHLAWAKVVGNGARGLQQLQNEFYSRVSKRHGMERGVMRDLGPVGEKKGQPQIRRHFTVEEMKASNVRELERLDAEVEAATQAFAEMDAEFDSKRMELNGLDAQLRQARSNHDRALATMERDFDTRRDDLRAEFDRLCESENERLELVQRRVQVAKSNRDDLAEAVEQAKQQLAEQRSADPATRLAAQASQTAKSVRGLIDECNAAEAASFASRVLPDSATSRDRASTARSRAHDLRDRLADLTRAVKEAVARRGFAPSTWSDLTTKASGWVQGGRPVRQSSMSLSSKIGQINERPMQQHGRSARTWRDER